MMTPSTGTTTPATLQFATALSRKTDTEAATRDLAARRSERQTAGTCKGSGTRTTAITPDGLGRVTLRAVTAGTGTGDQPANMTLDSAGDTLVTSGTQGSVTTVATFTVNLLDQTLTEVRTTNPGSVLVGTTKSTFDPAGNVADHCFWKPSATAGS